MAKTTYTPEIAKEICTKIADGCTLRTIIKEYGMGFSTLFRWMEDNPSFREQYALAKEVQIEKLVEEIQDIADDGSNDYMEIEDKNGRIKTVLNKEHVQRSRLRIDSRKWLAGKLKPKKYGDSMTLKGDADNPMVTKNIATDNDKRALEHFMKHYTDRVKQPEKDSGEDLV